MFFSNALLLGASLVVAVVAQNIQFTQSPTLEGVTAGRPTNLTWSGGDSTSPVTITLKQGDPKNLQTVSVITGDANGTSFTWTPSKSLPNGDYALEIAQGLQDINYSGQFPLTGGATTTSSISPSSATTSLSPASSSASSVSAALSSLNSTLSSILSGQSAVLITTTLGTAASSGGTGLPVPRNTTFVSQTLSSSSGAAAGTTTGGLQGGPPTTTAATTVSTGAGGGSTTPSASATSGAAVVCVVRSPLALVLGVVVAMVCV